MKKDWALYEDYIYNHLRLIYPAANIQKGIKIRRIISGRSRQVDIFIDFPDVGIKISIAVECKYFKRKVDVKAVESFLGFLQDIKVSKGILITNKGYSNAAEKRAQNAPRDIELKIIDFEKLGLFQGFGGIALEANNCSALFRCPAGWITHVLDIGNNDFTALYPFGLNFNSANELNEWIALRVVFKNERTSDITSLINSIEEIAKPKYPNFSYEYLPNILPKKHKDLEARLGVSEFRPTHLEYSHFLDCHSYILNSILYSPSSKKDHYLSLFKEIISSLKIFWRKNLSSTFKEKESEQLVHRVLFLDQ